MNTTSQKPLNTSINILSRDEILAKTWEIFLEHGSDFDRHDIVHLVGVPLEQLLDEFPTREYFLTELLEWRATSSHVYERIQKAITIEDSVKRFTEFTDIWINHIPHIYPMLRELANTRDRDPDAQAIWAARVNKRRVFCTLCVEALHKDRKLAPHFTIKGATDFILLHTTAQVWSRYTKSHGWSHEQAAQAMRKTVYPFILKGYRDDHN